MSDFWNNLYKFPRFLVGTIIGFFLTTFRPIFKLLKNKNSKFTFIITTYIIIRVIHITIKKMTGYE
uniref:Uncharacterized protein ycf33 n=1 Tax=Cliftonaea pectinata TaxID=2007206 RepID=A0A1Z1MQK2_9FLOR|nr:hypothetical protein [Cliftonaea pectinata]ARW68159.1 hypothetical protein [Cliftonaea pectinata]